MRKLFCMLIKFERKQNEIYVKTRKPIEPN